MEHLAYFGMKFVRFEAHGCLRINFLDTWMLELNFPLQKSEILRPKCCFRSTGTPKEISIYVTLCLGTDKFVRRRRSWFLKQSMHTVVLCLGTERKKKKKKKKCRHQSGIDHNFSNLLIRKGDLSAHDYK